jgi:hypothetical protein
MPINAASAQRQAVNLYFLGLGCVMAGACLMDYFDSLLPLAAGTSTALMLSLPLLQQLKHRYLARGIPNR